MKLKIERGFAHYGGWKFPADDPGPHEMTLREAIDIAGGPFENSGRWWSTIDASQNYRTGEDTYFYAALLRELQGIYGREPDAVTLQVGRRMTYGHYCKRREQARQLARV